MPLSDVVLPAITETLKPLLEPGSMPQIVNATVGFPSSIPGTPYIVLMADDGVFPPRTGSDLEVSDWTVQIIVLEDVATDASNAEVVLSQVVEPIRAVFRAHVQLGQPTIARTFISRAKWGYMNVNGTDYRTVTLQCECREKIPTQSGA